MMTTKDDAYWARLHIESDKRKPLTGDATRRKSLYLFSAFTWRKRPEAAA